MSDLALRLLIVSVGAFVLPWVTFRLMREVGRA
jgi:hypothetical protein